MSMKSRFEQYLSLLDTISLIGLNRAAPASYWTPHTVETEHFIAKRQFQYQEHTIAMKEVKPAHFYMKKKLKQQLRRRLKEIK